MSIDNRIQNKDGDTIMFELKSDAMDPEQVAMKEQKIKN